MNYRQYVKENYDRVRHLPQKERMSALAKLWHAHKTGAKGAGLFGDIGSAADSIGSLFGLGLEKQKKTRGRPRKVQGGAVGEIHSHIYNPHQSMFGQPEGAGLFGSIGSAADSIGSLFGLGLEKQKKGKQRKFTGSELMQVIAQHHKAKGGSFGDLFKSIAPILPLLAL